MAPVAPLLRLQHRAVGGVAEGRLGIRDEEGGGANGDGLAIVEDQRAGLIGGAGGDLGGGVEVGII